MMEEQAQRLDVLRTEESKQKILHKGHVNRMEVKHNSDISELKKIHQSELSALLIEKQSIEELYESVKKVTFQTGNSDGKLNFLKLENDQLKIQIG